MIVACRDTATTIGVTVFCTVVAVAVLSFIVAAAYDLGKSSR